MPPSSSSAPLQHIWNILMQQAGEIGRAEPALGRFVTERIVARRDFEDALGCILAHELADDSFTVDDSRRLIASVHRADHTIVMAALADLLAVIERDAATQNEIEPLLFFKGYHALQTYRVANALWYTGRQPMALFLQSRMSRRFSVDIHPAARIGKGIMLDHGNGVIIGETAVVEDNVSILHNVTLGGTGKEKGDRHPKIRTGVLIGAGAKILGNIEVGTCARVAAGSLVLENVPPNVTVAGVPARIMGASGCAQPAVMMDHMLNAGDSI